MRVKAGSPHFGTHAVPARSAGVLVEWNSLDPSAAADAILPCCGSRAWAAALAAQRPFLDEQALLAASKRAWAGLPAADWQQAFDSHPRIGERKPQTSATATSLAWSKAEQSAAMAADESAKQALREANATYEQRFRRIFIICAKGRTTHEILAELNRRLRNTEEAESLESAEQQAQITAQRLTHWLSDS